MATDASIRFYGLPHLVGETVQACVGGLDCGDYVVDSNGAITVPFGSDDGGLMTAAYLASLDGFEGEHQTPCKFTLNDVLVTVTVPVVIGKQYTSDGQILRATTKEDFGRRTDALGKTRRAHEFAALLHNVVEIKFGTDFAGVMDQAEFTSDGETAIPQTTLYSGVYRGTLTDDYGQDSMLAWRVDRPWPATVCAVGVYLVAEE